jgi:hypothetical protein
MTQEVEYELKFLGFDDVVNHRLKIVAMING